MNLAPLSSTMFLAELRRPRSIIVAPLLCLRVHVHTALPFPAFKVAALGKDQKVVSNGKRGSSTAPLLERRIEQSLN